jgi:hypothetical protein
MGSTFSLLLEGEQRAAFFSDRTAREQKNGQPSPPRVYYGLVGRLAHQRAEPLKTDAIAREADAFWIELIGHLIASVSLVNPVLLIIRPTT